jgi:hypothetical protein
MIKRLATWFAVGLIGLAVLSVLLTNADPGIRAERVRREQIQTAAAAQRAEAMTALVQGAVVIGLAGAAGLVGASLVLAGVLVLDRIRRAREIHADRETLLYPIIREGHGVYAQLNAPSAQHIAVMSLGRRRPTAAMIGRVLDAPPTDRPQIAAPAEHYPARVDVYSAPMPKRLALPIGVAGDGRHVALPLRGLGNVVVGGLPNYGKSELLASMAAGLLRQDSAGERQQIAIVDMKLVSFGNLPDLAALRWPVATDIDDAHQVIAAARAECSRRYEVLREARARTLEEYQDVTGEPLPYLTVLVDEIADLTQDDDRSRRERFLASAMEIARKGRAAGVGLVMATQRPSADVLPSSLRNLAGAAVAFRVQRNHDSIAVLGEPGAETLPAVPGRCLVRHSSTVQVQAFYAGLEGGRFDAYVASLPAQPASAPDGIVVDNWPTTGSVAAVVGGCAGSGPVVERLQPGREPSPQLAAQLRSLYAQGWSKTALCNAVWGYKDGIVWPILDRALSGDL